MTKVFFRGMLRYGGSLSVDLDIIGDGVGGKFVHWLDSQFQP